MRNASAWFGCLAMIILVGCATTASTGTSTEDTAAGAKMLTGGCAGTACTVILNEAGGSCSVDPPSLAIDSGYTVTFVAAVSSQTAAVIITPKAASGISFAGGPPGRINRGGRHNSGAATGSPGAQYTYNARFVKTGGQNVCPVIDPEICIKPGTLEPDDNCT